MRKLLESIAATAELMSHELTPAAAMMMAQDLSEYPQEVVFKALQNLRKTKSRFTLDGVIEQINRLNPDGRPGADEAWSMIPRSEDETVVWTQEMAEAYGAAAPLLADGDRIAARMAFKEAYARIVEQNKAIGKAPVWIPSLGSDKMGREHVLSDAVRLGRLSGTQVAGLLPPGSSALMLESSPSNIQQIESNDLDPEKARENLERLRGMLSNSKLVGKDAV